MASDVAAIERLEDHPMAVDPDAIEEEFARIWRETAGAGLDDAAIRVRVLNLVAVASSDSEVERFEEVMQVLPQRHPCRGILAVAADPYQRLGATISAHCWRASGGRRHVCSEEVLLSGSAEQSAELASAVLALLISDLPVAAWLIGRPDLRGELASRVLETADSVIVDSAHAVDLADTYASLLALCEEHGTVCSDLAWGRTAAWRSLAVQFFDGPDGARELDLVNSIEVSGGAGAPSSEALLLAGWLTSALGLAQADASADAGGLQGVFYDGVRGVRVAVSAADDGVPLRKVRLITPDAAFSIERHHESGHLHIREDWDAGSTRRTVDQQPEDDASVIALALDGGASAGVYEAAATAALGLMNGTGDGPQARGG